MYHVKIVQDTKHNYRKDFGLRPKYRIDVSKEEDRSFKIGTEYAYTQLGAVRQAQLVIKRYEKNPYPKHIVKEYDK